MPRLPTPGADDGTWADILNEFLEVSLDNSSVPTGGTIKSAAISSAGGQLTSQKGAANGYASLDSNTKVPVAQLPTAATDPTMGGDLSGTASNAQLVASAVGTTELAANAVTTGKILDANVTEAKLSFDLGVKIEGILDYDEEPPPGTPSGTVWLQRPAPP